MKYKPITHHWLLKAHRWGLLDLLDQLINSDGPLPMETAELFAILTYTRLSNAIRRGIIRVSYKDKTLFVEAGPRAQVALEMARNIRR